MQFGICTPIENADLVRAAGGDFIEEHVRNFLQGEVHDGEWHGLERMRGRSLPIPAANSLVPPHLKITGPTVDFAGLKKYMRVIFARAKMTRMKTLVFGSPAARNVPEGFDRAKAKEQILDFIRMSVEFAVEDDILLVAEPVNKIEANIMLTVGESMEYVKTINHPHFQCMVDSWHMWRENEPLEHVREAANYMRHVHLADWKDRRAPGQSLVDGKQQDYVPLFRILKQANYHGLISVEAEWEPAITAPGEAAKVLAYVKGQWAKA